MEPTKLIINLIFLMGKKIQTGAGNRILRGVGGMPPSATSFDTPLPPSKALNSKLLYFALDKKTFKKMIV